MSSKRRRPAARRHGGVKARRLGTVAGGDFTAEDTQAGEHVLGLVAGGGGGVRGMGRQHLRAAGLALRPAENMFKGLELEFQGLVALFQHLLLVLESLDLRLHALVLLLEVGHQLLQLHAADLRLQLLREMLGHFILLTDQLDNENEHEVDEEDGTLHDVLLGLRETLGWVPTCTLEEEVVDAAVQFAVELAQVLASIAFGNAVLLALIIWIARDQTPLALASAELLQGGLAVDVSGGDQGHDLGLREIAGPFFLRCEGLLPGAVLGVGRRGRCHNGLRCWPCRLNREGFLGARRAGGDEFVVERVEWASRQRFDAWQRG